MGTGDLFDGGFGRFPALQSGKFLAVECFQHRFQPGRSLRMLSSGIVSQKRRVRDKQRGHMATASSSDRTQV